MKLVQYIRTHEWARVLTYPILAALTVGCLFVLIQLPCSLLFSYEDTPSGTFLHNLAGFTEAWFLLGCILGAIAGLGAASEQPNNPTA